VGIIRTHDFEFVIVLYVCTSKLNAIDI